MIKVKIKKIPQARTGYQVQGALVNDVPTMGGADYNAYIGQPKLRESRYITAVPRDEANLEAEGGETVYGDINGDGMPEHQIIKGPRHAQGGVPLSLPEDTFIFSDTRGMKIKDPELLAMFGKSAGKSYTPAELAKQYDIQKYRKILEDPETDKIDRKTAEIMIKKYVVKLGCLALAQESKKGFPQGIPVVARPCMEARGLTEEDVLPSKEIKALNEQLKKQTEQQQGGGEDQAQQAMDMNQGQPVAQPSQQQPQQPSMDEMMMMYGGGMRRLRRAQAGMQQPSPEEMAMMQQQGQGQPEAGGQDQMMEIIQEVQGALQNGAQPQEVVMSLLQNGLPPEAVVQIFTQLGASQEEAAGLVQQAMGQAQGGQEQMMQQAPPMAQYGMSMGGYDMPFYDIPEAEYGMAMGANPNNYQGRPKRIPASGPMFPLVKAQDGIEIDASNMSEEQLQRAIWDAQQKNKNVKITVVRKDANGQVKKQNLKSSGFTIPEGKDITDLKGFPDTPAGRIAASQYLLIEENLNNPTVKTEIIKNTKEALDNPDAWTGKTGTRDANRTWTNKYGTLPSDEDIIKQALNHQKRNLMFEANEVDPQLFSDVGDRLDDVDKVISEGYVNPKTGKAYTRQEAEASLKKLDDLGYKNVAAMSEKLGVPLDPIGKDRVLQQATMHGYAKSYQNFGSGAYDNDPNAKYAMDNFLGNVSLVHSGANDETSMGALYGSIGNKISPLDDKYDYNSTSATPTWYGAGRGNYTTYGDTTAGHKYMVGKRKLEFEDIPEGGGPCQCDDPNKPNYKPKDAQGNCTCEPVNPKKCPCQKADGTVLEMTVDQNGNCPPCQEDQDIPVQGPPSEWWLQDTIKTTGAFGDMMGLKKQMPWAPPVELGVPRPTFIDPTRELAANAEQANIQTQGMAQFAGPQALSSRSASIQGQAAKNAADVLGRYNNANVNIANQFEMKANDIRNQESMLKQATAQRVYDQNTVANQQFDNAKLAMRNQTRNYYTNAITNRWKTDALNQMFPNYAVAPGVGGRMDYRATPKTVTGTTASTQNDYFAQREKCRASGATNPDECARNAINAAKLSGNTSTAQAQGSMINTMYPGTAQGKFGGNVFADGGFVYIDTWTPFLM